MSDQIVDILESVQRPQVARLQAALADANARADRLEVENERVFRGMVWAHYELAAANEPDTLWLMDLLAGLLDGTTADEAAAVARKRATADGEE